MPVYEVYVSESIETLYTVEARDEEAAQIEAERRFDEQVEGGTVVQYDRETYSAEKRYA